ncbi:hypothetical protein HDU76_008015 [Blyttiomyces sp. JEL0837]|nr:hypothetical protein HDU76_008015 [Blyttiomyces sp. JEL0837]
MAIASFTLFGIESIAAEIENPFGYDTNDLRMGNFCDDLRDEIYNLVNADDKRDVSLWSSEILNSQQAILEFMSATSPVVVGGKYH